MTYTQHLNKTGEYGIVIASNYPIITVEGLAHVHLFETVVSEDGYAGMVFTILRDAVQILLFCKDNLTVGSKVARTGEFVSMNVGNELLGRVIDPLGNSLFGEGTFTPPTESRFINPPVKGIAHRVRIKRPFETGVSVVDMMIPLGKGQRELIVGDKKIGKSSFVWNVIKRQSQEAIIIYAVIGRKKSEVKKLYEYSKKIGTTQNMLVIAANSDESPSLMYIAPLCAMTVAEYFRDQGKDVVVILDDLSTHAKFYREISLLAEHFPGRESYPGDIFFLHSRLLERAGNFKHPEKKEVSITCLPIVETVESDLSGYIPTNVMGMTDGHIFFDSNAFYNGLRPAVNIALSVTRVGKQTQTTLAKEINRELYAFLAEYERMQNYSHFGAELSDRIKEILLKGKLILALFQQQNGEIIPHEIQVLLFGLIWNLQVKTVAELEASKAKYIAEYANPTSRANMQQLIQAESLNEFLKKLNTGK